MRTASKKILVTLAACAFALPVFAFAQNQTALPPAPVAPPPASDQITPPAFMLKVTSQADFNKLTAAQKQELATFLTRKAAAEAANKPVPAQAPVLPTTSGSSWTLMNILLIALAVFGVIGIGLIVRRIVIARQNAAPSASAPTPPSMPALLLFFTLFAAGVLIPAGQAHATFNNNCGSPTPGPCGSPYADGVHVTGTVNYQGRTASYWSTNNTAIAGVPPGASIDVVASMSYDNQNTSVSDQVSLTVTLGSQQCSDVSCGWGGAATPASIPGTSIAAIPQWKTLFGRQSTNSSTAFTAPTTPGIYGVVFRFCDLKYGAPDVGPGSLYCYSYPDTIVVVAPAPAGACSSANGSAPVPNIDPNFSAIQNPASSFSSGVYGTNYPTSLCSNGTPTLYSSYHGYDAYYLDNNGNPSTADTAPGTYDEYYYWGWSCGGSGLTTAYCASQIGMQTWTTYTPPSVRMQFQ